MERVEVKAPSYGLGFEGKTPKGETVLVPFTAPGEVWETEPLKGEYFKPIKPLKVNPDLRRKPFCGLFPECSHCQWQHIKPDRQTELKRYLFREYIGVEPERVLVSPSETSYRVKTFLYHRDGKLGFRKSWVFDLKMPLLEVEGCPLLVEELNRSISLLRGLRLPPSLHGVELFANPQTGETFIKLLFLRDFEIPSHFVEEVKNLPFTGVGVYRGEYLHWERLETSGRWETTLRVGKYLYTLSPDCFIQPNRLLWEEFLNLVKPTERYERALELHAGIGFFTLPLLEWVESLESSDINPESFRYRGINARREAAGSRFKNILSDAYKHIRRAKDFDLLVVDPPRGGLTKPVVGEILKKLPREVIYISCNLESLKKDLSLLRESYELVKAALVDQFPNTYHLESVVWLRRR